MKRYLDHLFEGLDITYTSYFFFLHGSQTCSAGEFCHAINPDLAIRPGLIVAAEKIKNQNPNWKKAEKSKSCLIGNWIKTTSDTVCADERQEVEENQLKVSVNPNYNFDFDFPAKIKSFWTCFFRASKLKWYAHGCRPFIM